MFKMNDLVVPKEPHNWHDICCQVIRTRQETMCLVSNGRGTQRWLHESQLDYLCDVVHQHVLHKIATDPEIAKKTIFVVPTREEIIKAHCEMQQCDGCPNEYSDECEPPPEGEPDGTDDGDGWDTEYGFG